MATFVFEVRERAGEAMAHSWVAVERSSGVEIPLPHGGTTVAGRSFVGEYPEIQDFLRQAYRFDLRLVYDAALDHSIAHPDGKMTWIFHRDETEVIVRDIPRVIARLVTSSN
jgi:hypothetical protein